MATSVVTIVVHLDEGASTVRDRFLSRGSDNKAQAIEGARNLLAAVESGAVPGYLGVRLASADGAQAIAKIACTRANAATDTVTIEGVVLTEAGSGEGGFLRGADDTATGANLAACINAHSLLKRIVTASADTGTVTLTWKVPGPSGSNAQISTSDATAFAISLPSTRANIACTQANAATDTVTIQGVTLTEGTDFNASTDDATTATNLAAAINANSTLAAICAAAASAGTVRIFFGTTEAVTITTSDATAFAITRPQAHGTRGTTSRGWRGHRFGKGTA